MEEKSDISEISAMMKALSDPNRLMIAEMLSDGEKCACKLLERFNISQPTLSHHMKILCGAGLIRGRKEGKWMHYSLDAGAFQRLAERIGGIAGSVSGRGDSGQDGKCGCTDK